MSEGDRERWNARYQGGSHRKIGPTAGLEALGSWLPEHGRALDVAGGAGHNAIWLRERGFDVTLVDISDVAVQIAAEAGIAAVRADLEIEPLPEGPWDLVVIANYLQRDLLEAIAAALAAAGRLIVVHPTRRNLERHPKPSARFLLDDGEAPELVRAAGLGVLHYEEGWHEGTHTARLVAGSARKPP